MFRIIVNFPSELLKLTLIGIFPRNQCDRKSCQISPKLQSIPAGFNRGVDCIVFIPWSLIYPAYFVVFLDTLNDLSSSLKRSKNLLIFSKRQNPRVGPSLLLF